MNFIVNNSTRLYYIIDKLINTCIHVFILLMYNILLSIYTSNVLMYTYTYMHIHNFTNHPY